MKAAHSLLSPLSSLPFPISPLPFDSTVSVTKLLSSAHYTNINVFAKVWFDKGLRVDEEGITTFMDIDTRQFQFRVGLYPNWWTWDQSGKCIEKFSIGVSS